MRALRALRVFAGVVLAAAAFPGATAHLAGEDVPRILAPSLRGEGPELEAVARALLELGEPALLPLLDVLGRGDVQQGTSHLALDRRHEWMIVATLARAPRLNAVLGALAESDAPAGTRAAALRVLERAGGPAELELAVRLAPAASRQPRIESEVCAAFETAAGAILRREPARSARELLRLAPRAHPSLLAPLVETLAGASPDRLHRLVALLGAVAAADPLVLAALARPEGAKRGSLDERERAALAACLRRSDATVARLAAGASAELGVHEAIPELVELLRSSERTLQEGAHRALVRLAGIDEGPGPEGWEQRWASDEAWAQGSAECRGRILDGAPEEAVRALCEAALRRLQRGRAEELLLLGLGRSETGVLTTACRCLASAGSARSLRPLVALLEHREPAVRAAAHGALRRISGHDLPADPTRWAGLLDR